MKYLPTKSLLFACAVVLSSAACAADQQVETLLAHMREAYKAVKSATYKVAATVPESGAAGKEQTYSMDAAYKSPNMMRFILKGSAFENRTATLISDGENITVTAPEGTAPVGVYSAETIDKFVPFNLESICFWDWDRQLSTAPGKNMEKSTFKIVKDETWDGKHWIVLEETAAKDNVFCRYFIDPKTYLIWRTRVTVLSSGKLQMDAKLISLNPNANLNDGMFKGA